MSLSKINPTTTKTWQKLQNHFDEIEGDHMLDMFHDNPKREQQLSIVFRDFFVDFSKNRWTKSTIDLFIDLAKELKLKDNIKHYFEANTFNFTEDRAVLHTALRSKQHSIQVNNKNIIDDISQVKIKIKSFTENIISGKQTGYTDKPFTDVVNIGVGGSDLGSKFVCNSLKFYKNHLNTHFVSNIDGDATIDILQKLNPETTLFIVVSKSFGTQETLQNAKLVQNWFLEQAPKSAISEHFVAVTSNIEMATTFGISNENIFPMWNWVGGRFSLWSAVGLSIALGIGYQNFDALLNGAESADEHFLKTEFSENIPVLMAFLSVWHTNFFNTNARAVIPYAESLEFFIPYLQQAEMESCGKSADRNCKQVNYQTGGVVFGTMGTNSQHAFMQLLHQGTKTIPTDFIGFCKSLHKEDEHQKILIANLIAQSNALAFGTKEEKVDNLYKHFDGNKPSTTFLIKELSPASLGRLIAFYEHKIFVQGILWNINCYDQFGVELGKKITNSLLETIETKEISPLINFYNQNKK